MHTLSIPQSVIDRVVARRGREHVYDDLDPAKTALIVVDMQNAFMLPGVAHALCPMAEKIVPNINRLAQAVRETGGTVVWIKTTFKDDALKNWSTYFEMVKPEQGAKRIAALTADSKGHELWAALDVRPDDVIVEKNRFSAFIQGSSNLAEVLREHGLDTVLVTGTVTNVCCESTARDAMMLNFKTIMVTDGNAAVTDEDHNASLCAFYLTFGDIMSTEYARDLPRAQCAPRILRRRSKVVPGTCQWPIRAMEAPQTGPIRRARAGRDHCSRARTDPDPCQTLARRQTPAPRSGRDHRGHAACRFFPRAAAQALGRL